MNQFGKNFKLTINGTSHSKEMSMTIDGISKLSIDIDLIKERLLLRKGESTFSTSRRENDEFEIESNKNSIIIKVKNSDIHQTPNELLGIVRPGHADYVNYVKNNTIDFYDTMSSGRLTTLLVIVGTIFEINLKELGIKSKSFIRQIGKIKDESILYNESFNQKDDFFNVIDKEKEILMKDEITKSKEIGDSLGGIVETYIKCPIVGLGEPFFDSFESMLSHLIFSIPGINGIAFGEGFNSSLLEGSTYNDIPKYIDGKVYFETNHAGGLNGGMTNGNIINFKTSIRPTSSIYREQRTINVRTKQNDTIKISSRNDTCFVPRALHVINACSYIVLYDLYLDLKK